ncbi:hypothetical protein [Bradyrhizobium sp.]|uniref:hypothetical protein n=1 Tax=Bradyrhizobium sp. TaxID=376 RepID=UPI0025C6731D|nr:hypothetical protein [Bradyrhizobium sp.]
MPTFLRLYEDILSSGADAMRLPALPRMVFIVHGAATIGEQTFADGDAWAGEGAATLTPGPQGVAAWRFEVAADGAAAGAIGGVSRLKLSATLETLPQGELLLRGDSVAFPPGGCAYLHRHQGPGIRCLLEGGIRIDTHGRSTSYGPGGAWFESGPDGVFAQGATDRATRFVRVMVLPRALIGKSSIEYLNESDKAKPKSQSYKIFADLPIALQAA